MSLTIKKIHDLCEIKVDDIHGLKSGKEVTVGLFTMRVVDVVADKTNVSALINEGGISGTLICTEINRNNNRR